MHKGLSRRDFLKYSLVPLVAGISLAGNKIGVAAISALNSQSLKGPLGYHTFAALLGQPFKLIVVEPERKYAVRVRLDEVISVSLTPGNDQFYLVFKVFSNTTQPNGTYQIRHATAGSTRLFLQSLGDSVTGNYCRADFNLLL
jgi:hypothetical protein